VIDLDVQRKAKLSTRLFMSILRLLTPHLLRLRHTFSAVLEQDLREVYDWIVFFTCKYYAICRLAPFHLSPSVLAIGAWCLDNTRDVQRPSTKTQIREGSLSRIEVFGRLR